MWWTYVPVFVILPVFVLELLSEKQMETNEQISIFTHPCEASGLVWTFRPRWWVSYITPFRVSLFPSCFTVSSVFHCFFCVSLFLPCFSFSSKFKCFFRTFMFVSPVVVTFVHNCVLCFFRVSVFSLMFQCLSSVSQCLSQSCIPFLFVSPTLVSSLHNHVLCF